MHHIRYYHAGKKWKFFHANLGGPSKKTFPGGNVRGNVRKCMKEGGGEAKPLSAKNLTHM